MVSEVYNVGWCFDNSYSRLPEVMLSRVPPTPVKKPKLVLLNNALCDELGLDFSNVKENHISSLFSGNILPPGSASIAQAYAGHQFGFFTVLGDGRALLLGEHISKKEKRFDIQLKGSGRTPYSRSGDGRAALGPVLREYIISEAMSALEIPTTRSLAVVSTGESIVRDSVQRGAILTRVASSHIRVGTFQYVNLSKNRNLLEVLVNYVIERHYPEIKGDENPALRLLEVVLDSQIKLIVNWMRVGFIHGVMNTDNMSVSGETIDYGPCAFMDVYDQKTVFSSIDTHGRYSYGNQPLIANWNLYRFAESLLPVIDSDQKKAAIKAKKVLDSFSENYKNLWFKMMKKKLGLLGDDVGDEWLINNLLDWLYKNKFDYTNFFRLLMKNRNAISEDDVFVYWYMRWRDRIKKNKGSLDECLKTMSLANPAIIPRNHIVESVLKSACDDYNFTALNEFLDVLGRPYDRGLRLSKYKKTPVVPEIPYKTFCGT